LLVGRIHHGTNWNYPLIGLYASKREPNSETMGYIVSFIQTSSHFQKHNIFLYIKV